MDRIFSRRGVPSLVKEAKETWQEVALVDISYEVLDRADKTLGYREIFKEAAKLKGLTYDELMELIPQVYTEMNLDGRFICLSPGEWGLKKWYTTESIEESIEALARSRGIDDDDDSYGFDDEADEDFVEEDEFTKVAADDEEEEEDVDADADDEDIADEEEEEVEGFEDEEDSDFTEDDETDTADEEEEEEDDKV
jgi:DNA-directed RNA polymerase subunit delta